MLTQNLLSLAIWLPILGGVAVLATGSDARAPLARALTLIVAVATFAVTVLIFTGFSSHTAAMQYVELRDWIPAFNIHYHLGVDGISLLLVLLTSFTTILVVIAGWQVIQEKVAQYLAAFLIMEGVMIGVFAALAAILFYVFWEAMLIPMFVIIGMWGGSNRVYATIKFFLYTLLGSVLMLVAFVYLYLKAGKSFDIHSFYALKLSLTEQVLIFFAFFAAFAVKVPMWPVHTWLPDAHVEAPTGGSIVLAAIMLKLGAYGFLRFSLPIVPDASRELSDLIIVLSLVAVVYVGVVGMLQRVM